MTRRVAVIGAGITGLAAAWQLQQAEVDVVVFDPAPVVGGKLQASLVPSLGFALDEGADAFLARVPDAVELCAELGIDDLVHPAIGNARVYAHGALRPLPTNQLLGVPTDLDELAATGLVSDVGLAVARADAHATWAPPPDDMAIGALIRSRLGDEVCDHLVEPLLGGINAGEADRLSAEAAAPQIWACARRGGSLIAAASAARAAATASASPVFATPAAGLATLPTRLGARLRAEFRLGTAVHGLGVDAQGRAVVTANTNDGTTTDTFDGVVVATPASAAAPLLAPLAPAAATQLAATRFASVVMVTIVASTAAVGHTLDGSGFVVARTAGLPITACSWGSSKWAHWADGSHVVFRVSIGHDADPTDWCGLADDDLVVTALAGLRTTMGIDVIPTGTRVTRWKHSFPQYETGHVARVAAITDEVRGCGPIAIAGASLGGIGVPACIRQGRTAARQILG